MDHTLGCSSWQLEQASLQSHSSPGSLLLLLFARGLQTLGVIPVNTLKLCPGCFCSLIFLLRCGIMTQFKFVLPFFYRGKTGTA